jgi:hypothetical protein
LLCEIPFLSLPEKVHSRRFLLPDINQPGKTSSPGQQLRPTPTQTRQKSEGSRKNAKKPFHHLRKEKPLFRTMELTHYTMSVKGWFRKWRKML